MTHSTSKALVAWRQWCRLILQVDHPILSYMYNFHHQIKHLQLQHLLLVERKTRPLPDTLGWDMHLSGSMFDVGNTYWGMTSTSSGWQSTSDWRRCETSIRRGDVLPTTSTSEGTLYIAHDDGSDDESDADPPQEATPGGAKVALFSKLEPVPTIPEDVEGGSDDEEEDPRRDHTSFLLDSGELEVGKEFSNKDSFFSALKQHSIMNGVNYKVVKSKSDKFEAKCAVKDGTCSWKIMASLRKKIGLWEIKKYKGPHICVAGVSEYHPKMDSNMLPTSILQTVKVLERYVPGCGTDLETEPAYYNDRLLRGCQLTKKAQTTSVTYFSNSGHKHTTAAYNMRHYFRSEQQIIKAKCKEAMYGAQRPHEGIIGRQYRVHLRNRTCNCGRFDALRYPCAHVIAACQNLRLDPMSYVDEIPPWISFWGVVVPSARDLVVGVGRVTHLDRIITAAEFASPMANVFESRKVIEIGRKKSSPMAPHVIPHATTAYRSTVDSE
ncbi:hypothetical protein GOBAR_AA07723 [Gossypium barbadense]|uniref:SWIM-type domain-containing protein n=1 Tax=Gossypium barbadense TaxID=3634 RepID=A0A2P5YBD7_GOSBA|nr:hypothetical protein GOBAR_AA07723 [Gossypium barbadense]